ncbi:MAG: hypothetical protein AB7F19_02015 [Candidatus Babeliales bacterium]
MNIKLILTSVFVALVAFGLQAMDRTSSTTARTTTTRSAQRTTPARQAQVEPRKGTTTQQTATQRRTQTNRSRASFF